MGKTSRRVSPCIQLFTSPETLPTALIMASTEGEKQEDAPEQNKPEQVEEEGEIAEEPNADDHKTPQESKQTQEEHKSSSGSPEKSAERGLNHEDTQQQVPSY